MIFFEKKWVNDFARFFCMLLLAVENRICFTEKTYGLMGNNNGYMEHINCR